MKWSNVCFSSERTTKQREEMGNLRNMLQQHRQNCEQNLIIKYIKGISKIVNTKKTDKHTTHLFKFILPKCP